MTPVRRIRDGESIPPLWLTPGDSALYRAIAAVWEFGQRTTSPHFPPGVYKHRSIEALNCLEEEWAAANFRAFWERRRARADAAPNVTKRGPRG
ncbi:MAG: hypothetical protein ACKVU1_05520 [bacterium]